LYISAIYIKPTLTETYATNGSRQLRPSNITACKVLKSHTSLGNFHCCWNASLEQFTSPVTPLWMYFPPAVLPATKVTSVLLENHSILVTHGRLLCRSRFSC